MIARHSFGGGFETQVWVGALAIMTTVGACLAYYNVKQLQIDQHRAWMIRTWFYAATIISTRIIMILSTLIISSMEGYYRAMPCEEIDFLYDDKIEFQTSFPQCLSANSTVDGWIAVKANFPNSAPGIATAFGMTFGTAGWLALLLHAIGVEIYLHLTPRENERLRAVSYQRQLEAGRSHPGSSGLTSDRLGDSDPWQPPNRDEDEVMK